LTPRIEEDPSWLKQQQKQGADAAPKVGAIPDLYRNYNFMLSSREMGEVRFTECFGLGVRIQPIRYRESGAGQIVRTLPGPVEYAEVTLRYGLTKTPACGTGSRKSWPAARRGGTSRSPCWT
jgi:hypothetical protein